MSIALTLVVAAQLAAPPAPARPAAPAATPLPANEPAPAAAPAPDTRLPAAQQQLVAIEVLLDRAHFSPGVIDGKAGDNLTNAAAAWGSTHKQADATPGDALLQALAAADGAPVLTRYTITDADVTGPFRPVPKDYEEMATLDRLGYATPREALAEKFHMDETLLQQLNPGVDFGKAGTEIAVAAVGGQALARPVARIEVDKTAQQLRAYDATGKLEAVYPATVGSTERPAPSGSWAVRAVALHPTYTYDPSRLTFGKPTKKLTIAAGPNNPVGATWISLSAPTYGIHGAPDPSLVGKRASHGCVRLTNWDAIELGRAVRRGSKVVFIGAETRAKT